MLLADALTFFIAFSTSPFDRCDPGGIVARAMPSLLSMSLILVPLCTESPSIFILLILCC